MQSAPAVQYPVGRSHIRSLVMLLPWLLGGGALLLWGGQVPAARSVQTLAWLLWLVCGLLILRDLRRAPQGLLHWDGRQWRWQARDGEQVGVVRLRLDLQRWLLLEFRPQAGAGKWLWPQRDAEPQRWDALRRALVCTRGDAPDAKVQP